MQILPPLATPPVLPHTLPYLSLLALPASFPTGGQDKDMTAERIGPNFAARGLSRFGPILSARGLWRGLQGAGGLECSGLEVGGVGGWIGWLEVGWRLEEERGEEGEGGGYWGGGGIEGSPQHFNV